MSEKDNPRKEIKSTEKIEDVEEIIEAITYQDVLSSYAKSAQNLGQIIWVDNITEDSNKINVVRVLSDGTKQLFSLVLTEEKELLMKK
jgi:hypothetical protein